MRNSIDLIIGELAKSSTLLSEEFRSQFIKFKRKYGRGIDAQADLVSFLNLQVTKHINNPEIAHLCKCCIYDPIPQEQWVKQTTQYVIPKLAVYWQQPRKG